ncbi:SubName: Full=Uncharacterized protein {ECO:0000313/EMBL:CCA71661.1} [Serendipita indica DSM 11827]|nr:SubName: Full=Uncharacterized protein {ECO:0000313/EMBL:CCA71661.1} [Serendipita indica DSM 11827]
MSSKLNHTTGIPFRARLDLLPASVEELPLNEGDIVEVLDRGEFWWIAIAKAHSAPRTSFRFLTNSPKGKRGLVLPEALEPISGSIEAPQLQEDAIIDDRIHEALPEITIETSQSDTGASSDCASLPLSLRTRVDRPTLPRLISPLFESSTDSPSLPSASSSSTNNACSPTGSPISPDASPLTDGIKVLPTRVRALSDVTGTTPGELSFKAGDIIDVDVRTSAEIWHGILGQQTGTFRLDDSVEPILKERVRALLDHTAASSGDLSFKAGDIIQVYGPSTQGTWWWHGFITGKGIGMFPFNFVEPLDDEFDDSDEVDPVTASLYKPHTKFRVLHDVPSIEDGMLSLKQGDVISLVSRPFHDKWEGRLRSQAGTFFLDDNIEPIITSRVCAIYDYKAQNEGELTFARGDVITVIQPSEESTFWWYGATKNDVGIFPFNYIDIIPDEKDDFSDSEDWIKVGNSGFHRIMRALHDFHARERREVSFKCGDLITFLEDMDDPRWFIGRLGGCVGIFLHSYCEEVTLGKQDLSLGTQNQSDLPPGYDESSLIPSIDNSQIYHPLVDTKRHGMPRLDMDNLRSGAGSNPRAKALQDFRSGEASDLSFVKGDIIEVLSMPSSPGWWKGRLNNAVGIFPSSLTKLISYHSPEPSSLGSDRDHIYPSPILLSRQEAVSPTTEVSDENYPDAWSLVSSKTPYSPVNIPLPWKPCFARVLHDFQAPGEYGIQLISGDIVQILAMPFEERWTARSRNRQGLIPANYVRLEPLVDSQDSGSRNPEATRQTGHDLVSSSSSQTLAHEKRRADEAKSYPTSEWVRVRHDFNSGKSRELVLKKGDLIRVLKKPRQHWWKGRLQRDGTEGLFPANYVEAAPPPIPPAEGMSQSLSPSSTSPVGQESAIMMLDQTLLNLSALLKTFDTRKDLSENVEIQTLYWNACTRRKKMSKLQDSTPKTEAQIRVEALFEAVKSHYNAMMELSATRHGHQVMSARPHVPSSRVYSSTFTTNNTMTSFGSSSGVIVEEPSSYNTSPMSGNPSTDPSSASLSIDPPPATTFPPEHTRAYPRKRSTGNSTRTFFLPPTPAIHPHGPTTAQPQRLSQIMSVTVPTTWSPNLAFGTRQAAYKFEGDLAAISADIEKAKQAYKNNKGNVASQSTSRKLPSSPAVRILRRVARAGRRAEGNETVGSHGPHNKAIIKHEIQYRSLHVVHSNFTPVTSRRPLGGRES